MKKILVTIMFILISVNYLFAGEAFGLVRMIQIESRPTCDAIMVVLIDGTHTKSGCVTEDRFAFDASTPKGKLMAANFMAAKAQGVKVRVIGTGDCGVLNAFENINFIRVDPPVEYQ